MVKTATESERLTAVSRRATTSESFGQSVVRQVLTAAAERLDEGDDWPVTVEITFRVGQRKAKPLPSPPSPHEIDVCYEIVPEAGQTFLQSWLECTSPIPAMPLDR